MKTEYNILPFQCVSINIEHELQFVYGV